MIVTKDKILEEIKNKNIVIKPFNKKQLGPASYDLTLSDEFRIFLHNNKIILKNNYNLKQYTKKIKVKQYNLKPGEFILGITKERIKLSNNIAGFLTGRSRYARLGLVVHATASFIQPGIDNKEVLEIRNLSDHTLVLKPGLRIAQIIFIRCQGKALYKGRYKKQKTII